MYRLSRLVFPTWNDSFTMCVVLPVISSRTPLTPNSTNPAVHPIRYLQLTLVSLLVTANRRMTWSPARSLMHPLHQHTINPRRPDLYHPLGKRAGVTMSSSYTRVKRKPYSSVGFHVDTFHIRAHSPNVCRGRV